MYLSKASKYGIWGFVLSLPIFINFGTAVYFTLGFLVMTLVLFKDITPALLYADAQQNNVRKLVNFFVSCLFAASMVALIYWVSFYLLT